MKKEGETVKLRGQERMEEDENIKKGRKYEEQTRIGIKRGQERKEE
jgi:hypothetical protein